MHNTTPFDNLVQSSAWHTNTWTHTECLGLWAMRKDQP